MPAEVHALIESIEQARSAVLSSVAEVTDAQASIKPADGGWSIAEIVEHLYLAELSGVTKIWAALGNVRAGQRFTDALPNRGKRIEDVVAATWQPREIAPPIATPHIGGPLAAWVSNFSSLRAVLHDLEVALHDVNLEDIVFPHYLSGPLDGRQRLEFLRFHMERHMTQIARVKSSTVSSS